MNFNWRIGLATLMLFGVVGVLAPTLSAQTTILASWDMPPTGSVFPGGDFDPTLDTMLTCSGCWRARNNTTTGTTYSQSTTNGVTQGTGALQATLIGKGNGGEYTPEINGVPVQLDTHFDYPLVALYSNNPDANGGVLDPRFTAIKDAVDGVNPGSFYTLEFDITYDVASMRAIPWQPPEETVNPGMNNENRYPHRFFWIGMYGNAAEADGFTFVGFDANTINPFDAQWDNNMFPVFPASFPLSDFTFMPNSTTSFYEFGILYNSVFGTQPAASNTHGINIYFDNFRLVEHNPVDSCDFNGDNACTIADFQLFMAQHLTEEPTLGDYDMDGDNDFLDFQEFENFYDLANLGDGALRRDLAGVPEPGSVVLIALGLCALAILRSRRSAQLFAAPAALLAITMGQQADAQIVETFDTIGRWQVVAGAPAPSNPSIAVSPLGATHGGTSLKVTQAEDTIGDDDFVWLATTNPNWTAGDPAFEALRHAVNIGAEHFNLLADVTFRPQDLFDQGVNALTVTLGLNFNGQTIGTYTGEATEFTNTAVIPLTEFDLPDVEDQGATSYSAQVGFNGDALNLPFSVYIDNIRLEQISTPDLLTLEIDRSTGAGTLKNLSTNPISWDYLEIKSPGESLDVAGWNSLDDQNVGGNNTWIEAGGSSSAALVEGSITGSHTLAPGEMLPLGNLYNEALNAQDVDFEIRRAAGPSFRTFDQIVNYIGEAPVLAGDFSGNGAVENADLTLLLDNWGAPIPPVPTGWIGSQPTAPAIDNDELTALLDNWGAGSDGSALSAAGIPEPATAVAMITSIVAMSFLRRRGVGIKARYRKIAY